MNLRSLLITINSFMSLLLLSMAQAEEMIVTPIFEKDQIIFATVVATDAPFLADPTGQKDSTEAINQAMLRVSQRGGGTCYLPPGRYKVEGQLKVPATVTLKGGWYKPEIGKPMTGTILMAYAGRDQADGAPFIFGAEAGQSNLNGLTVWYPEQLPGDIHPYPYTIDLRVSYVTNVTLVNSYQGIRMRDVSGSIVRNVYGTVLAAGIETRKSTEFCRVFNVFFSPDYWLKAGDPFVTTPVTKEQSQHIADFVAERLVAVRIGKSDAMGVYNIQATPAKAVIEASMTKDEESLMLVNRKNYGFGGLLWKAPGARLRTDWDPWYFGAHYVDMDTLQSLPEELYPFAPQPHPAKMSKESIFIATQAPFSAIGDGKVDDTTALKAALKAAADAGGGTVFLPHGVYRLTAPIDVPAGVELRGAFGTDQIRAWFDLTTLWIDWLPAADANVFTTPASVTLQKGAGVRGLIISHSINIWETDAQGKLKITPTPYDVRFAGPNTYAQDLLLTNSYLGFDIASFKCDDFVIKDIWGCCLREGIRIGGGTVGGSVEVVTIDFGPWQNWKRLPKDIIKGVHSPYNEWLHDNLDLFVFEDCSNINTYSIAGFYPRVHAIFREKSGDSSANAGKPVNVKLWMSLFDVARDQCLLAQAGDNIYIYGAFITGGDSGMYNWLEFRPSYTGTFQMSGPMIQPIFFNHPLGDAPKGFTLDLGTSLTTKCPIAASSMDNAKEHPAEYAVDNSAATYWESKPGPSTLTVDLGKSKSLDRWRVVTNGIYDHSRYNVWSAALLVSDDGKKFKQVDAFDGNTVPIVERPLPEGTKARYVRLRIDKGSSPLEFQRARIHQFDVYDAVP